MKHIARPDQRGTAVVELAICLPIIVLIIVAGLDVHRVLRVKQDLVEVTHETARVIATNELTETEGRQFALRLVEQNSLSNPTVLIEPAPSPDMPRGTPITVSVSIPVDGNLTMMTQLFFSRSLVARSTVIRELGELPPIPLSDDSEEDD